MHAVALQEVYLAEYTRKTEFVLSLKICTVTPLEYYHGELVTSRDKIVGDVKFARHMADLTVSHEAIVQEEIKAGVNTLKVEVKAFISDAVFRYIKFADVKSAGFLVGTNGGSKVMG